MRKLMLIVVMVMVASPALAQGYHRGHGGHGHGGWVGPAIGGLALGAIMGGIMSGQQQQLYAPPAPTYYAPPAPTYYAPPPVYYPPAYHQHAPMICRMVPYDVAPNGSTVYRQECRD